MRNSKISIVKFLLLGIAMLMLGSSSAWAQVSVTLPSVTKLAGSADETLSITTGDLTGQNVSSFQFKLYYNKNVAYITNAVKAGVSDVSSALLSVNADTANGVLQVAWANADAISGSGTLVNIVVHYRNVGTSNLTFDDNGTKPNSFLFNAGNPAAAITNGSISIPSLAVSFGTMDVTVGDTVMIPVSTSALTTADNVMSYEFTATYNKAVLKVLGADVTGTLSAGGSYSANPDNTAGTVRVAWASANKLVTASGATLVNLKAVVIGAGTSAMGFSSFKYNTGTPSAGAVAGTVTATTVSTYTVSGTVTYQNASNTPVSGAVVTLTPASGTAVMDTTDAAGAYSFAALLPGTFTVSVAKTSGWGGVNAADALEAARYYNNLTTLDTLQILAGDVTGNGMVNNSDALDIVKRFVNLISSFSIPDWMFYPGTSSVTITNANITNNIKALAAGDINESFTPGVTPKTSALSLSQNSEMNIKNGASFEVPISIANNIQVGALSLKLSYPQNMVNYNGISVNGNLMTNEKDGIITIGWADLTGGQSPMNLKAGSVIATLKFTAKEGFTNGSKFGFDLLPGSEIVDARGNAVASSEIQAPEVSMSVPSEFSVKQNYPNPFNPSTTIDFSIPEAGNVTLTIYNVTGQVVTRLVNGVQNAGAHHVVWNASNLSSGVYFYRIDFDGQNRKFSDIKSMVLLK